VDWRDATNYATPGSNQNVFEEFFLQPYNIESANGHDVAEVCVGAHPYWIKKRCLTQTGAFTNEKIQWGAKLLKSKIQIKPQIQTKVNTFFTTELSENTLGIHLRGCDKKNLKILPRKHCSSPMLRKYISVAKEIIRTTELDRVFVCSDDTELMEQYMKGIGDMCQKKQIKIVTYDAQRAPKNQCLHLMYTGSYNPLKLAEEALIECLLLSKCSILIKSDSNFSNHAVYFNPQIRYIDLSMEKGERIRQFFVQEYIEMLHFYRRYCERFHTTIRRLRRKEIRQPASEETKN